MMLRLLINLVKLKTEMAKEKIVEFTSNTANRNAIKTNAPEIEADNKGVVRIFFWAKKLLNS